MELKSLETALRVLSAFSVDEPQLGVREISARIGSSPSVVHRILATFQTHGFVRQLETKKYTLAVRLWELGWIFKQHFRLSEVIQPRLDAAAVETQETVYLNFLEGDEALCVQIAESPQSIKIAIRPADRTPLFAGSRGRVMLAFLPPERQGALIDAAFQSGELHLPRADYEQGLADVRARGWCLSKGERRANIVGVSFPVFDRGGNVMGSVTAGGPDSRMTDEKVERCVPIIRALAAAIQSDLQKFD